LFIAVVTSVAKRLAANGTHQPESVITDYSGTAS
jgi:hypothetical protein